ncbi:hypothetical protein D3C80_1915300 [compost metagenome]
MHGLGAIDADRQAKAVGVEPIDDFFGQQSSVGGHDELHLLARFGEPPLAVSHHVLDQRPVGQRFATEEHHAVALLVG